MLDLNLNETIIVEKDTNDYIISSQLTRFPVEGATNFIRSIYFRSAFIWSDYAYTFITALLQELDMHYEERCHILQHGAILEVVNLINGIFRNAEDEDVYVEEGSVYVPETNANNSVEFVVQIANDRYLHYFKVEAGKIIYRLIAGKFFAFGKDAELAKNFFRNGYSVDEIYEEISDSEIHVKHKTIEQVWNYKGLPEIEIENAFVAPKEQKTKKPKTKKATKKGAE